MTYAAQNFEHLLGTKGFSEKLLQNHFKLYQGYVVNFNKLNDLLKALEKDGKFGTPEFAELNRRLGWEFNGMRLHEYYFGNMAKTPQPVDSNSPMAKASHKEWRSFELWEKDFTSMGAMRGIGWDVKSF